MSAKKAMKNYQPELGQLCFGQPWKRYDCSDYLEAALRMIQLELERVLWNIHQKSKEPFENIGDKFKNDVFEVEAYSWDEDRTQPYNFKCGDIEVSWYKHLGRGMSVNREVSPNQMAEALHLCLDSIKKIGDEHLKKLGIL